MSTEPGSSSTIPSRRGRSPRKDAAGGEQSSAAPAAGTPPVTAPEVEASSSTGGTEPSTEPAAAPVAAPAPAGAPTGQAAPTPSRRRGTAPTGESIASPKGGGAKAEDSKESKKVEEVPDADAHEEQEAINIAGLNFTRAEAVHVTGLHFLILIYGDSGAGKTHFACQAEDVVVVLVEPQGFATIHDANAQAMIVGSPDETIGHPRCKTFQEVRTFFAAASRGQLPKWVKTIVIDSLTELQQLMIDEIVQKKRAAVPKAANAKPGAAAKPGEEKPKGPAPEMTKQDWGTLSVNFRNFMRMLRGLPYNIICLCLPEQDIDEETGKRTVVPKLSGGMKSAIPAYFNIVGYIYKQMTPNGMQRAVMLDSDAKYLTKSYGGLVGVVEPDVRKWFRILAQEEESGSAASSLRPPGTVAASRRGINSAAPAPAPAASGTTSGQEDSEY